MPLYGISMKFFFINKTTFCLLPLCVCLISLVLLQLVEKSSPTCDNSSKMSQLSMMHQVGIGNFLTNWPVDTFFTLLAKGFLARSHLTNCRGTHWFKTMQPRKMCLQPKKKLLEFFSLWQKVSTKNFHWKRKSESSQDLWLPSAPHPGSDSAFRCKTINNLFRIKGSRSCVRKILQPLR